MPSHKGHPGGGWKGSQASLDALAAGRLPASKQRQCYREHCRQPACARSKACRFHGGAAFAKSPGPAHRIASRAARREIYAAVKAGAVPEGLAVHPAWIAAGWGRLVVHRPHMLRAYRSGDPAEWARVLAAAEAAIAAHPRSPSVRKD